MDKCLKSDRFETDPTSSTSVVFNLGVATHAGVIWLFSGGHRSV